MKNWIGRSLLVVAATILFAGPSPALLPPAPPPPRPFDDPTIARRFEAWERAFYRNTDIASTALARARTATRSRKEHQGAISRVEKAAAKNFALARRHSLEGLRDLVRLNEEVKATASSWDRKRLESTILRQREWFTNTEPNSLEILEALTEGG